MTRELNKLLKLVGKDHEVHLMFNPLDADVYYRYRVYVRSRMGKFVACGRGPTMTIALQRAIRMFKERTQEPKEKP